MPLLTVSNVHHAFGTRIILNGATLSIEQGEKLGMVGRNGTGKTTLLSAIRGDLEPDSGTVQVQKGTRVGYLGQHPVMEEGDTVRSSAERAFEKLHALHQQLNKIYDQMAEVEGAELDRLLARQATLESEVANEGGYAIDHLIDGTLSGLGFTPEQFSQSVDTLSGGEKGRLGLARLLLERPGLLLLDEPTNHLDIDGRRWLERFLSEEYDGAVLVVSHDRWLLDRVVNRIAEVERGALRDYPGNYHAYIELRRERMLTESRRHAKQLDKIRSEEAYIRKYKEGQRAKQARGRAGRLERFKEQELVERPIELDVMKLTLPKPPRVGDIVISAEELTRRIPDRTLFENFSITIRPGDRIGVIGPNGIGKTTLIRTMLGDLESETGDVRRSPRLSVGWFRQTHEHLDLSLTVWQYLQSVIVSTDGETKASEQQARNLAGAFLFSGAEQDKTLDLLSGGERARALLAGLVSSAHNLLVLDEPSNHLDIPSAERLEQALLQYGDEGAYGGALLLVSHDRALLEATCTQLIVFEEGRQPRLFRGRYSDFLAEEEAKTRAAREDKPRSAGKKTRNTGKAERKKPRKDPLARLTTGELEEKIEALSEEIKTLDVELADPDAWSDHARSTKLQARRKTLQDEMEPLEFEWSRRAELE
jgi:ATP-binding cassette subfamily F protein 3